jgi:hypothetical protein
MPKDWSAELDTCNFRCSVCRYGWEAKPDLVEPDEEAPHHPYRYFANCPACRAQHQPQAPYERALLKAWQHATGPRTPEGIAATSANLVGHPTPEEALRTRFNAMKHGMHARTAHYFPAKPDGYPFCSRCDVDRYWCGEQPACVKQTEKFMLYHAAFDKRDPRIINRVKSDLHAALVASLEMAVQAVLADGVVIKTPKVVLAEGGRAVTLTFTDDKGQVHNVYEYMANPAFKPIADLVTRLGLSMQDLGMTDRAAQEDEAAGLRGRLAGEGEQQRQQLGDYANRLAGALANLGGIMKEAKQAADSDPVLLEHQAQTGGGGGGGGSAGGHAAIGAD